MYFYSKYINPQINGYNIIIIDAVIRGINFYHAVLFIKAFCVHNIVNIFVSILMNISDCSCKALRN